MEHRELKDLLDKKRLLLYGIGNQFKECYKLFQNKDIILFDGNSKKWGMTFDNKMIFPPEEMVQYIDGETCIVITSIYNQYETEKELKEIFTDCPFAYDFLLLKGKLFRCAHVAHLNNLQVIDSTNHDCIDFTNISEEDINPKKNKLLQYMKFDYLEGCQYCNGIKNSIQGIPPAIQGMR